MDAIQQSAVCVASHQLKTCFPFLASGPIQELDDGNKNINFQVKKMFPNVSNFKCVPSTHPGFRFHHSAAGCVVGLGRPVVRIRTSLQVGSSRTRCHGPWAMPATPPGLYGLKRCLLLQPFFFSEIHFLMPPIAPRKKYNYIVSPWEGKKEHIPPGFRRGLVELDPNDLAARAWCDYGVSQLNGLAAGRWKRWKHHPEPRGCLIGLFITFLFAFDKICWRYDVVI